MNFTIFLAMEPLALTGNAKLAVAMLYGMVLGLFLIKSRLADRETIFDNLTLKDFSLLKMLLLALGIGTLCFMLLRNGSMVQQQIPEVNFWAVLLGGLCAGIGLGLGGLATAPGFAALAAGRLYALWLLLGMLAAIPAARWLKPHLTGLQERFQEPIDISLEPVNGIFVLDSPVLWILIVTVVISLFLHICSGKGRE